MCKHTYAKIIHVYACVVYGDGDGLAEEGKRGKMR